MNASYRLFAWGTMPVGAALGGLIASQTSLTAAFWTSVSLGLLCLPIIWTQVTTLRLTVDSPADTMNPLPRPVDSP